MKRRFIGVGLLLLNAIVALAGGGKLVIVMEESGLSNQFFLITGSDEVSFDFHKAEWKKDNAVVSAKHTPLGWCLLSAANYPLGNDQRVCYKQTKEMFKAIQTNLAEGFYATSIGFGQMDGLGRSYWQIVTTKTARYTGQEVKETKFKGIEKWAKPYMDQGYRVTIMAPSTTKWVTVLTKGTDIDKQTWAQYNNYDEFVAGVQQHWDEGYSLQFAEVSPAGKYVGVFCTYADGRHPRQFVTVVSSKEEARNFINKHYGNGVGIVHFGGSYLPGLLCNYDSPQEKMNAVMGITGGLLSSTTQLAGQIQENRNKPTASGGAVVTDGENVPSGLSQAEYQGIYDRFARNAESAFNSLTAASLSGSKYTAMKKSLRDAQKSMRKTREEARRAGHTLQQSKWETATVTL